MKAQEGAHNNTTRKLYYYNKWLSNLKLNTSQSSTHMPRKHKKMRTQQNEVILDNDSSVDNFSNTTITQPIISSLSDYTTMYPITTPFQLAIPVTNTTDTTSVTEATLSVTKQDNLKPKKDKSIKSRRRHVIWGAWHPWSECSRTCGSGVMSQRRDCIR